LFFPQSSGEFAQAQVQVFDGAVAIAEARIEFAFAKREDMGADLEVLLKLVAEAIGGIEFQVGAAAAFFEGLHPQGFGDVGDGFGEAVQGGGAGIQSCGEGFPPGIEGGVDGVLYLVHRSGLTS
jgi:hypothetical protein